MRDVNLTYGGSHCTIYVNQIIMAHTLNLYSDVCQLCVNNTVEKTSKKKKRKENLSP